MDTPARPLVIAHRGFHLKGIQENSVKAMRAANAVADGVEFDVRQTRDGILILCHDSVAFGRPIATTDFPTLRDVSEKNGAPIPTLEEAMAVIEPGQFVFAEVKVGGIADRVVAMCRPQFGERFRIGSFRYSDIASAPKELRWLITFHALQAWPYRQRLRGVDYRRGGSWVRRWGVESSAWTVNDAAQVHHVVRDGVQFITTDDPEGIRKVLQPDAS